MHTWPLDFLRELRFWHTNDCLISPLAFAGQWIGLVSWLTNWWVLSSAGAESFLPATFGARIA